VRFVNENFINYGLFHCSNDFDILKFYVDVNELPVFVVFTLNKAAMQEMFVNSYSVQAKGVGRLEEWLREITGVRDKRKKQKTKEEPEMNAPKEPMKQSVPQPMPEPQKYITMP
jgi:hypothetical protein